MIYTTINLYQNPHRQAKYRNANSSNRNVAVDVTSYKVVLTYASLITCCYKRCPPSLSGEGSFGSKSADYKLITCCHHSCRFNLPQDTIPICGNKNGVNRRCLQFALQENFYFCHQHNGGSGCLREDVRPRRRRNIRRN